MQGDLCYDGGMEWLIALLLMIQAAEPASIPGMPEAPGVYYRQNNAGFVSIKPAPIKNMETRGLGTFVETGGYTNLGMSIVLNGARAQLRLFEPKPTFFIRGIGSSNDVMLIRLKQKRDTRTFQASSSDASMTNKAGLRKDEIRKMVVTEYSKDSYSVTPEESLKPGEYLLVFGSATTGFDFGIDPEK